jgi:hypothetical protein
VKFKELAYAILVYSAFHHRDTKNIRIGLAKTSAEFGERVYYAIVEPVDLAPALPTQRVRCETIPDRQPQLHM